MLTGNWDWLSISFNMPMEEVRMNPLLSWNKTGLSMNPGITLHDVHNLDLPNSTGGWSMIHLSSSVPMQDVRDNPHLPWNKHIGNIFHRSGLSLNPGITLADLDMDLPIATGEWDWDSLSMRIPMEEVRRNPSLPWNRYYLSRNKGIILDDVHNLNLSNGIWNWDSLSMRIPMEEVRRNSHLSWNKHYLSRNKGIAISDIIHLNLPNSTGDWDYIALSTSLPNSRYGGPYLHKSTYGYGHNIDDALNKDLSNANLLSQLEKVREGASITLDRHELSNIPGITIDDLLFL